MVGSQSKISLVVTKNNMIVNIFYLGYSNLSSSEYDRLHRLAVARGYNLYLTELAEAGTYAKLYQLLSEETTPRSL